MRLPRLLRQQDGIALVMALGTLGVLTMAGSAVMTYTVSNVQHANRSKADEAGLSLSEAGINNALSILTNPANDPRTPTLLPPTTANYPGGSVTWSGTLDGSGTYWTINSTSIESAALGNTSAIRHTNTIVAELFQDTTTSANLPWNYVYSGATTCGPILGNNITFSAPVYSRGDFCMGTNDQVTSPTVFAVGRVTLGSGSNIGSISTSISSIHTGTGCSYNGGATVKPCTAAQHVYASVADAVVPAVTTPPLNLAYWYANSWPGPMHGCTVGFFPGGFDTNTTMNGSRATVDLFPAGGYDCQVWNNGQLIGQITWVPASNTFKVLGTIFFDGAISMTPATPKNVIYSGNGTIYADTSITLKNITICAVAGCPTSGWDPNKDMLLFVTPTTFNLHDNSNLQGAVYASTFDQDIHGTMQGPIIGTTRVDMNDYSTIAWPALSNLPLGAPTNSYPTVRVKDSSWSG